MPKFFRDLRRHNDRDWFEAHREVYEECVKAPMLALTAAVSAEVTRFAPEYASEPRKAIFRIYRDTRFSNDKTPYKTHTGALLRHANLAKNESASFYFAVSDENIEVAGGNYRPGPEELKLVRAHIAANAARFEKLVNAKARVAQCGPLQGAELSRPPRGYCTDTPGVEWIRRKQWYCYRELDAGLALSGEIVETVVAYFRKIQPLVEFLNEPLIAQAKTNLPLTTGWF
jgi:uncharacterized protein (TIGR02453 family)